MKDIANLSDTLATEAKGVTVQASTLGALEALLEFLRNPGKDRQGKERPPIPVSGATVGPIHKKDVIKAATANEWGLTEVEREFALKGDKTITGTVTMKLIWQPFA